MADNSYSLSDKGVLPLHARMLVATPIVRKIRLIICGGRYLIILLCIAKHDPSWYGIYTSETTIILI